MALSEGSAQPRLPTLPGTSVEITRTPEVGRIRHALFDFDGTLSNLRDGWQDHMVPMMVEILEACPRHESREEIEGLIMDFVDHLTGKQTIYQMLRLVEEIEKRGGTPGDPLEYKRIYHERLAKDVEIRISEIRSGRRRPEDFLVRGSRDILEALTKAGIRCYVASGTDVEFVLEEARILDVEKYFADRVFGALPNYKDFSKEKVIRKILADFSLSGPELLVVGDGYVEIQNGRDVEAITWGVYTPENNRYHMNENKRERLLRAGAHLLSEDFVEAAAVLRYLKAAP